MHLNFDGISQTSLQLIEMVNNPIQSIQNQQEIEQHRMAYDVALDTKIPQKEKLKLSNAKQIGNVRFH